MGKGDGVSEPRQMHLSEAFAAIKDAPRFRAGWTGLALAALAAAAGLVGAVIGFSVGIGSRLFNIITQP